jgi:hypothetical protein
LSDLQPQPGPGAVLRGQSSAEVEPNVTCELPMAAMPKIRLKQPMITGNEPVDHAIGRSRGGLTTKAHGLVDGGGRVLHLGGSTPRDTPRT